MYLISIVYLAIFEKDKKIKGLLVWGNIILLVILWNPITIEFCSKFMNYGTLYRLYYILPLIVTIGYSFTKIITSFKNKYIKLGLVIVVCGIIILNGTNIFKARETVKVSNLYKLQDETVAIAEIIEKDSTYKEKNAVVPYYISAQIQQIYPDINLLYTRIIFNPGDGKGSESPYDSDSPDGYEPVEVFRNGNVEDMGRYANDNNLNYIVINKNIILSDSMESIGFEKIAETNENTIYRKIKEK